MTHRETAQPTRLLITAGPTHEPIDAVRFLGNRSSGRMGVALALAAVNRGWETTLLLGPTHLETPCHSHLRVERFRTTADLQASLGRWWPEHDMLIMAAAVADYRPVSEGTEQKIRRGSEMITLELEPTPDLLAGIATLTRPDQVVVGFALEPRERLEQSALDKLDRKRLDAIVANPLETMDSEKVDAVIYFADGTSQSATPGLAKTDFGSWLLDRLDACRIERTGRM